MKRLAYGLPKCLLLFLASAAIAQASPEQSSLLGIAQDLHCTQSEQQAASLLTQLSALPIKPFGIPKENSSNGDDAVLYAATVDILLEVLLETIKRYPKLQESAERIALLWNYCEIIDDGELADLIFSHNHIVKSQAIGPFPANKRGFGSWGLLDRGAKHRYVPEILRSPSLYPRAYQDLLFRLTQQQCFPHPEPDVLDNEGEHQTYYGSLHMTTSLAPGKKYPYFWQQQCNPSPKQKKETKSVIKPIRPKQVNPVFLPKQPAVEVVTAVIQKQMPRPSPKIVQQQKPKQQAKKTAVNTEFAFLDLAPPKYVPPTNDEIPVISPAIPPSGNSNIGAPLPLPPANGLGVAGNFYHRAKLTGAMSFGANASWKPLSYFFVRGGVNYSYLPNSGKFSYSWGLGYDDWHPGTFSAQLNNWGPIVPGKGDFFAGAIANFGYKFVADFLKPYHLTGSASVNVPLSGNPSVSTTWVWSPIEHWFIRGSLSKSLVKSGGLNWSYGFGYSDWHPFTFSLTYDNWGTNPIFDSSQGNGFNFTENGAISLSWSWAF